VTRPVPRALAAAAAAVCLLFVPAAPAAAHGGPSGYVSTVTAVRPDVPGLRVDVVGGDDRLRLTAPRGTTVVVLGYDGEPYLRIGPDGVDRNMRSPATYLNRDRYARVSMPGFASATASPTWERVAGGRTYTWHDHRIHWMNPDGPGPDVPNSQRDLMNWTVTGRIDGRPLAIRGTLEPAGTAGSSWWAYAAFPALALAALAALGTRALRRSDARAPAAH